MATVRNSSAQPDHGREADAPTEVPPKGWKDILWRTYAEINDDRVTLIAAAVTYYLLLAIFPTLTAFVSLYGLFTDPATVTEHIQALSSVVPEGGMAIIDEQLKRLTTSQETTLSFALLISIAIALWSASSGVKTLFEAMNIAYDEREKRNFFVLNATALLFTLAGVVGAVVMIGVAVVVPAVLTFLGLGAGLEWVLTIGSYLLLVVVLLVGIAALYRFGPSRQQAKWRWVTPGALLTVFGIIIVSLLFSWYAANFANFDKTYGSLGGLIALLTWMWISVTMLIVGAELNAEAERQTRRDSTVGSSDPLGHRQATAADTVGKSSEEGGEPDDDISGKSPEWQAGYHAAMTRLRPRRQHSLGALALAVPASVALGALRRRDNKRS